jgi:membrane protein implicated in regulation of membrane protease activity
MLLASGQALTAIEPGGTGRVATHGEIWTATAAEPISPGDPIVVTAVRGLIVTVRRA